MILYQTTIACLEDCVSEQREILFLIGFWLFEVTLWGGCCLLSASKVHVRKACVFFSFFLFVYVLSSWYDLHLVGFPGIFHIMFSQENVEKVTEKWFIQIKTKQKTSKKKKKENNNVQTIYRAVYDAMIDYQVVKVNGHIKMGLKSLLIY